MTSAMNLGYSQSAGYIPPGGTNAAKQEQQELWDQYQRQQASRQPSSDAVVPSISTLTASRERADSLQSQTWTEKHRHQATHDERERALHPDDDGHESRMRSSSLEHSRPWQSQPESRVEIRRLSAHFNSPTAVEVERQKEHRKSVKGVEKLKGAVRAWAKK